MLLIALGTTTPAFAKGGSMAVAQEKEKPETPTEVAEELSRVILQLSDGSRIVGMPSFDFLPIQTAYTKVKLPLTKIESIQFNKDHETILINLKNGDRLQGTTDLAEINLQTLFGKVSVGLRHLVSLQMSGRGTPPITDGLILWLDAREVTEEKWPDKSGQSGDGVVHNVQKTDDGAALFNGKDSTVTIPKKQSPQNLTVNIWAKKSGTFSSFDESFISCGVDNDFFIAMEGNSMDNAGWAGVIFTETGLHVGNFTREIFITRWIMFSMVYDGKALALYQDGVRCVSIPATGTIKAEGANYVLGRREPGKPPYSGYLGDVQLYNRALSEEEIMHNFKAATGRFVNP